MENKKDVDKEIGVYEKISSKAWEIYSRELKEYRAKRLLARLLTKKKPPKLGGVEDWKDNIKIVLETYGEQAIEELSKIEANDEDLSFYSDVLNRRLEDLERRKSENSGKSRR